MALPQKLLARTVVLLLLLGMLPALQPPAAVDAQDTATYTMTKYDCPAGYDPGSGDASAAFASCVTPAGGVAFTLVSGDGAFGGTQATDGSGATGWSGIPLGVGYSVTESLPSGYGAPWVYCEISGDPNNPGDVQSSFFQAPGGTMDVGYTDPSLTTYTQANCTWFDITPNDGTANLQPQDQGGGGQQPPDTGQYVTVTINKYVCAYGFEYGNVALTDLMSGCQTPQQGAPFTIGGDQSTLASTDNNGVLQFTNISPGSVTVREEAWASYDAARVFCSIGPDNQAPTTPGQSDERGMTQSGGDTQSITIENVQGGQRIYCLWFDATVTEEELGSVVIYKNLCPDGYDPSGGFDALFADCTASVPNAAFHLSQSQGGADTDATADASGITSFLNYTPGSYALQQTQPSGHYTVAVYCYSRAVSTGQSEKAVPDAYPIDQDGSVQIEVQAGKEFTCYWFDSTSPPTTSGDTSTTGSITITKYLCYQLSLPLNSPGPDYNTFSSQCTEYGEGIQFTVSTASGDLYPTTGPDGMVAFDDLAPGAVTISESLPSGYDSWAVYCTTDPSSGSYEEYAGEQVYQFAYTVEAGVHLTCSWFDQAPSSDAYVSVTKYICEEGDINKIDPEYLDYNGACQDPGSGWKFTLSDGVTPVTKTTGAGGDVTFGAAAGTYTLAEEELPGYASLALYCNDGSNADAWEAVPLTGASGSIEVASGETLTCQWFNYHYPNTGQTITITKYTCENFLVRGWPARSDYEEHCTTPQPGIGFTMYAGMAVEDTATTDSSGVATLTASQPGQYQIIEMAPEGYVTAAVYCSTSGTDDPAEAEALPVTINVTADYPVTCVWYNGEDVWGGAISDPGTVVIHKYECPAGYPDSGTNGFEEILGACTLPGSNVAFSVSQGGTEVDSGSTDTDGELALTGAATGITRISEFPIEGWEAPRVFCAIVPVGIGRGIAAYDEQTVTTWGVDIDLPADSYIDCYWFNRPPSTGTDGQPIQIIIHKVLCAPDTLPGSTYEDAIAACDQKEEGVDFALTGGDGGTASGPTDVNGYAEFNGLAPGTITITEAARDGYKTGAVFCSAYTSTPGDFDAFPVTNEAISYYLAGGYKLECYWFNIQEPPTGTIYIFKYACASEVAYTSYDDLKIACPDKQAGVPFEVQIGSETWNETTDASGGALFYELPETPTGAATIAETSPAGYRPYAVFCGYSDYGYIPPATVQEAPVDANSASIQQVVVADKFLMCYWFNAPDQQDPQVWISKYNCGEDANWHWDYHELLSHCTEPGAGVEFGFGPQGSGQSASVTDDQGRWLYDSLSPGVWYWQEYFPTGYSGAVVYCQWVDQHGSGEYQKAELDGATLWLDLDYGQIVTCYWFDFPESSASPTPTPHSGSGGSGGSGTPPPPLSSNIPTGGTAGGAGGGTANQPTDPNAPATLIIVKRTCPDGYDLYGKDADVEQDCSDLTKDIDFELTSLTPNVQNGTPVPNEPMPQTTGDDGKATWANLAAGPYLLVETMPENTHAAFIWTCKSDQRQFQLEYPLTPFSYAGPDGETGITLIPGETLECAWYDVPTAPGTITILLFECPGSPVIVAQCQPAGQEIALTLAPVDAVGPVLSLTTDENGSASGEGVGVYSVTEEGATPCLIDSDAIDDQGHLVVGEGDEIEMRIYNCGGGS